MNERRQPTPALEALRSEVRTTKTAVRHAEFSAFDVLEEMVKNHGIDRGNPRLTLEIDNRSLVEAVQRSAEDLAVTASDWLIPLYIPKGTLTLKQVFPNGAPNRNGTHHYIELGFRVNQEGVNDDGFSAWTFFDEERSGEKYDIKADFSYSPARHKRGESALSTRKDAGKTFIEFLNEEDTLTKLHLLVELVDKASVLQPAATTS